MVKIQICPLSAAGQMESQPEVQEVPLVMPSDSPAGEDKEENPRLINAVNEVLAPVLAEAKTEADQKIVVSSFLLYCRATVMKADASVTKEETDKMPALSVVGLAAAIEMENDNPDQLFNFSTISCQSKVALVNEAHQFREKTDLARRHPVLEKAVKEGIRNFYSNENLRRKRAKEMKAQPPMMTA